MVSPVRNNEQISEKLTSDDPNCGEKTKNTGDTSNFRSGLYYFNARWYDADLGRFTTEDPARDGVNWYIYVSNNPLRFVDPSGLRAVIGEHVETGEVITEDQYTAPETSVTILRSTSSYESKYGDLDSQGYDSIKLTSKNVLGEESSIFVSGLQTVDILTDGSRAQGFEHPIYGKIEGNTIATGDFDLIYDDPKGDKLGPVILFANTRTIDGTSIGHDGNAIGGGENRGGRWRLHDSTHPLTGAYTNNLCSDGCGIGNKDTSNRIFSFFRGHIPVGHTIQGELKEFSLNRNMQ